MKIYTIKEFCELHKIGISSFRKLRKENRAPKLLHIGRRILISKEAIEEWRKLLENTK